MSLAHSFDVKDPQDLLRGLQNALNEYDQSKEDGDKPKMVYQPPVSRDKILIIIAPRSAAYLDQVGQNDQWVHPTTLYHTQMHQIPLSLSFRK